MVCPYHSAYFPWRRPRIGATGRNTNPVLAWAFAEAAERRKPPSRTLRRWESILGTVQRHFPDAQLNGPPLGTGRVLNNVHVCIPGVPTEPLINALSSAGVYVSGGSACSSGRFSHVLKAIGKKPEDGAFLRLTVGPSQPKRTSTTPWVECLTSSASYERSTPHETT